MSLTQSPMPECVLSARVCVCVRASFHPRRKHVISRAPVLLVDRYNIKSHKSECELRGDGVGAWGRGREEEWGDDSNNST